MKLTILVSAVLAFKVLSPPVLISSSSVKLFHEGPIYDPILGTVLISSDIIDNSDKHRPGSASTILNLSSGDLVSFNSSFTKIPYANGGVRTSAGYIICGQGDIDQKAGLYLLDPSTMTSKPLVTSYQNASFNSPNDIVMRGNQVYFTDPDYGYMQGFRALARNSPGAYRAIFDVNTKTLRNIERILVNHVFDKPNGVAVSPDGKKLFVTDTGYFIGNGSRDLRRPRDIFVWDMDSFDQLGRSIFKTEEGIPDGIKFDSRGRLWVGNYGGRGILQIDPESGEVLASIEIAGGSANFAFADDKERQKMIIMGDYNLWKHELEELE